ncbi:polygalacturonase inhibitor 1-like [Typha angustifolia]|uniref:polygalacturonase inhibitor 1-like n=1 Tax=Typha angustifolia TaxID=59011 RepID=UPI003C2C1D4C
MSPPSLWFILPLFLFFLITLANRASAAVCHESDHVTLLKIKKNWGNPAFLSTWIPSTDCCTWDHIVCSDEGRVEYLGLSFANVSGRIPPAIGDLSELTSLEIAYIPRLTGPIPSSFAKLSNLASLLIRVTSFSGPIPEFLANCTNLAALTLSNNKISGPIPRFLSTLPSLGDLDLGFNSFSGAIPPNLLHGQYGLSLTLSNNKLTGEIPRSYGDDGLDAMDLSHNRLRGDPSFLFGIGKHTRSIDLSWNELEFDLTHVILPHYLNHLDLSHNRINGSIPKSLKGLNNLGYLNLTYNRLCGEIPTGRYMEWHSADCYLHNKCLCGTPLPPCQKPVMN